MSSTIDTQRLGTLEKHRMLEAVQVVSDMYSLNWLVLGNMRTRKHGLVRNKVHTCRKSAGCALFSRFSCITSLEAAANFSFEPVCLELLTSGDCSGMGRSSVNKLNAGCVVLSHSIPEPSDSPWAMPL